MAATFGARLRGWIGRHPQPGEALWLGRCAWIHTWGVPAAIDVVWCASDGTVRRTLSGLRPWRAARVRGAADVCELPAGQAAGVALGDHLDLVPD